MTQEQVLTPKVKLCGLRGTDDARDAVLAGADLVGIVLVAGARRYVAPPAAASMVRAIHETAADTGRFTPEVVGVVGDMPLAVAVGIVSATGVDTIQLVGADAQCEPLAAALAGTPLIRSIPVRPGADVPALQEQAAAWEARGARVVFDAVVDGALGGTGVRIPAELVGELLASGGRGLAGGLDPDNVAQAIRELRPAVVDVSSGIESPDGHKSAERMRAFVAAARATALDSPHDFLAPSDHDAEHAQ